MPLGHPPIAQRQGETTERALSLTGQCCAQCGLTGAKLKAHHGVTVQRRRDVGTLREHLVELTAKLDGLTTLHADHARTMLRESQDTSVRVLEASCSLVRAEVDIFESLARKGWSGGGLDELLEKGRDLFASEDDALVGVAGVAAGAGNAAAEGNGAKLFSILPPRSILQHAESASDSGTSPSKPKGGHGRSDSLLVDTERYQSLAGAVGRDKDDADSIFSDFNQSRGVRPFSPQPVRRTHTDVVVDPDAPLSGDEDVEGARDASAQGLSLEDLSGRPGEDSEREGSDVSPWKHEGLGRAVDDLTLGPPDKEGGRRWGLSGGGGGGREQL